MRTLSVIKADIGSNAGHWKPTKEVVDEVEGKIEEASFLDDYFIFTTGDDIDILMSHTEGEDSDRIHQLAWDAFEAGTEIAKEQGLYGAGQDLLKDAFSGNIKGLGPGVAEIQFEERQSEPFLVFGADKTEPGSFNQPFYTTFADPRYTTGLIIKDTVHKGFNFVLEDMEHKGEGEKTIRLKAPEESWKIAGLLMESHRFGIKKIYSRHTEEQVASVSTQKLRNVAGRYVGKDDPVAIVRTQSDFPSPGEVLQPYASPAFVAGSMRGSHYGTFYPIKSDSSEFPSYFDGPPLLKAIGMVVNDGEFSEPLYPFDFSFWDSVRQEASQRFREFREKHGIFNIGTVESSELEYGGWSDILTELSDRWEIEK